MARDVDIIRDMNTTTNPLATLGLSLSRGATVALGGAIERGPRYGRRGLDADRPGTTTAQFAYQTGSAAQADDAIAQVTR